MKTCALCITFTESSSSESGKQKQWTYRAWKWQLVVAYCSERATRDADDASQASGGRGSSSSISSSSQLLAASLGRRWRHGIQQQKAEQSGDVTASGAANQATRRRVIDVRRASVGGRTASTGDSRSRVQSSPHWTPQRNLASDCWPSSPHSHVFAHRLT